MTAKQEAAAMVLSFLGIVGNNMKYAKECALITVNKILSAVKWCIGDSQVEYWEDVKKEIENL